jgi:hypothetical protein
MLDHLGDVGPMTRTDFAQDTFANPDEATKQPVTLCHKVRHWEAESLASRNQITDPKDCNVVPRAIRRSIGLNHAEHAMQLPIDKEDEK